MRRYKDTYYFVCEDGRVYSGKTHRFLRPRPDRKGYHRVSLRIAGKTVEKQIHRLVAECFLQTYREDLTINHIDGVKTNNQLANLECVTQQANNVHAMKTGLNRARAIRTVEQWANGTFIKTYDTVSDASKETNVNPGCISYCLRGITKHAGGFQWRYAL